MDTMSEMGNVRVSQKLSAVSTHTHPPSHLSPLIFLALCLFLFDSFPSLPFCLDGNSSNAGI